MCKGRPHLRNELAVDGVCHEPHQGSGFLIKFTADEVPRRFKTTIALINLGEQIADIQEVWKAFKDAEGS